MAYDLQPLITILEQILNPKQTRWNFDDNKAQLQSLLEKSVSLQQIFEETSLSNIECLETQIRDAVHKAEDMIESHMIYEMLSRPRDGDVILEPNPKGKSLLKRMAYNLQQICNPKAEDIIEPNPKGVSFTFSTRDLQKVMQRLDFVMEQAMKLIKEKATTSGVSFSRDVSSKSIVDEEHSVQSKAVVGVDEDMRQLMDRVMGEMQSKLEIVPIVGMGGIGKTTLVRKLYQDPSIVEHFKYCAWSTVSQDYNMEAILLNLLRCILSIEDYDRHTRKESHELKDILYRSLYGRRYLIVLDDIWSSNIWDEIRKYFPDNNNGSRIVITTRETGVAKHANSLGKQHEMQLLNESESWNLLREEAFGDEEDCSAALERIGRNIARNCGGLPLAICVIGGLLSKANKSEDVWKNVANDVRAAIAKSDGQFFDILSLSYNHMPSHLRPCFLYMGAFPEDYKIKASRLIRLWVAEGFLKPNRDNKSLEEEAEDCLKALVDRNLVSVSALKSNGRAKSYSMHDLMRDLCLKKAEKQRFVHVWGECKEFRGIRRVSTHPSIKDINLFYVSEFMSLARSYLFMGPIRGSIASPVLVALRLLRVLDLLQMFFNEFPKEILQILNLRYLALFCTRYVDLPSDISRLCNLQTLVIVGSFDCSIYIPYEILQMAELRHVAIKRAQIFFDTDNGSDWGDFILEKLQTIFTLKSSHEFLHRIPNIKTLGIIYKSSIYDLYHLQKLETLRFSSSFYSAPISPSVLRLPPSLKKLSLTKCRIDVEFMNYLCELPNLEVLKLTYCKFGGGVRGEWDATEQEFCTLKFLLLDGLINVVKLEADETNFPRLRHLVIRGCLLLQEIPSGIGEIPTLQMIELAKCSPSLVASAKLIIKEQRDNGNDELQLRMT